MRLEVQISKAAFIASLRRRAADANLCWTNQINVPGIGAVIIDRFTLLETTMTLNRVTQRMRVRFVSLGDLEAAGPDEAEGLDFEFSVLLDLQIINGVNGWEFRTTYAGVDNETLPEAGLAEVDASLTQNRPYDRSVPLNLTPLFSAFGFASGTTVAAGLTSNETSVALRIDFSPTPNQANWADFLSKGIFADALLPEQNFALFIDKDLLMPGIRNQIQQELAKQLSLNSVSVQWLPQFWGARFHVDVGATKLDGCETPLANLDVDVDIDIDIDVSLPQPNTLQSHAAYTWDVDNWDVLKCSFVLSVTLSSTILIHPVFIVAPIIGFFAPIYFASEFNPPVPDKPKCLEGDKSVTCTQTLPTPTVFGPTTFQTLTGLAKGLENGLLFRGTTPVPGDVVLPVIAQVSVGGLGFGVGGGCKSLKIQGNGEIDIEYQSSQQGITSQKGTICSVTSRPGSEDYEISHDGVSTIRVTYPFGFEETIPTAHCRLLLQTTGGARIVDLGTPPEFTDENQQQANFEMKSAQGICADKVTGPADKGLPGPGPGPQPDETLGMGHVSWFDDLFWQQFGSADVLFHVIVRGGKPGDHFTLTRVGGGDVLGMMTVPGKGASEFGTFATLGTDKPVLTIPGSSWTRTRLFLMGTVLQQIGTIQTPFAPTAVQFGFASGQLVVTIADEFQSQTFSLHQPRSPVFLRADGPIGSLLAIEGGKPERGAPALMQTRPRALFVARSDGGGNVLDMSDKKRNVLATYTGRPWFVATDKKGRLVAHSLRNKTVIYRVVAVHREEISPGASQG